MSSLFYGDKVCVLCWTDDSIFFTKDVKGIDEYIRQLEEVGISFTMEKDFNVFLIMEIHSGSILQQHCRSVDTLTRLESYMEFRVGDAFELNILLELSTDFYIILGCSSEFAPLRRSSR